ncbi:MAG: RdgB/HAM1 family non-canonical purine NTP pyrophosphatase [Polyangiaceae bacterium]|nr:RdgB/HAM1 family non-canonical purine NTP pyrophosphatase [Polyangiaceae bacterium]
MRANRIVLATTNRGKVAELAELLAQPHLELSSVVDTLGRPLVVDEDGDTFLANAAVKARAVLAATGLPSLADDSGLEVDALDGRPGVRSARFAGAAASDQENIDALLAALAHLPDPWARSARFRCVLALALPGGEFLTAEGCCDGWIALAPRGDAGFGYDPVFVSPELGGRTLAEVSREDKARVSHRARAARALRPHLGSFVRGG